jgi:hypothetical protein
LATALSAFPTWSDPVGLGAKRTRLIAQNLTVARSLESYLRALRSAERLVYLENQFLWSPEIVTVLVDKLRHPPSDEFRLLACTLHQRGERARPVYVPR